MNGDLVKLLRGLPARGLAGGADPAVIASVGRHPMLLQMLVWILSRAQHALWGGRHELTGPEVKGVDFILNSTLKNMSMTIGNSIVSFASKFSSPG